MTIFVINEIDVIDGSSFMYPKAYRNIHAVERRIARLQLQNMLDGGGYVYRFQLIELVGK